MPESQISIGAVSDDIFNLSTSGARAISTLGLFAAGDRSLFEGLGVEGSIRKVEATAGKYSIDWLMRSKDYEYNDSLYVYNGRDVIKVADRLNGTVDRAFGTSTFEVLYDSFYIAALDVGSKSGTTDYTVLDIERRGDLDYTPPVRIDLAPTKIYGDLNIKDKYIGIATGGGDRAISSFEEELGELPEDDLGNFTEGSYAQWQGLENGLFNVTGYLYSSEENRDRDAFGYFRDDQYFKLMDRSEATQQLSRTRWRSEAKSFDIEVTDGNLTLWTFDEDTKSGTTEFRVQRIERTGDLPEPEIKWQTIGGWGRYGYTDTTATINDGDIYPHKNALINDIFNDVDTTDFGYGGTGIKIKSKAGVNEISFRIETEGNAETSDQLLLWTGEKFLKAAPVEDGSYKIKADLQEEWALGIFDRNLEQTSTIKITNVKYLPTGAADALEAPEIGDFPTYYAPSHYGLRSGQSSSQEIENELGLETSDYGERGTFKRYQSKAGVNELRFEVETANEGEDSLFIWDGEKYLDAGILKNGDMSVKVDMKNDEWGLILLDGDGGGDRDTTVKVTHVFQHDSYRADNLAQIENAQSFAPVAEWGNGDWEARSNSTVLNSGGRLTDSFFDNSTLSYGQAGSVVLFVSEPGVNEVTFNVETTADNEDQLLVFDGENFLKIDSLTGGTHTVKADMVSDEWGMMLLDRGNINGNTTVEITGIKYWDNDIADNFSEPEYDSLTGERISWEQHTTPTDLGNLFDDVLSLTDSVGSASDPIDVFTFNSNGAFDLRFSGGDIQYEVIDERGNSLGTGTHSGDRVTSQDFLGMGNQFNIEILTNASTEQTYNMNIISQ